MVKATLIFSSKFFTIHKSLDLKAVVEMKIYQIPVSMDYPERVKYSLFCIDMETNTIIVGFDNHRPKGHHVHINDEQNPYFFRGAQGLVDDFYTEIRRAGFEL